MRSDVSEQRDLDEFRSTLKVAKRKLSQGHPKSAEILLQRAYELAGYLPVKQREAKRAFIEHRLAEAAVLLNKPKTARWRFEQALELVDTTDKVAHARILRDFGNFERLHGKRRDGLELVREALKILESIQIKNKRTKIELIVTQGFLARFDLNSRSRRKREVAIEQLRWVAAELHGYKKKAYELANLKCLVSELPIYSVERLEYLQRAVVLSLKLGNLAQTGELMSLLGGWPSRSVYSFTSKNVHNFIVRAFS